VVRSKTEQVDVPKENVERVDRLLHRSRARAAAPWIGAAGGFAVGFGVGYAGGDPPCRGSGWCGFPFSISKPTAGLILGGVGTAVGGVTGYLLSGKEAEQIYRKKR
jgi:hypothetical protein